MANGLIIYFDGPDGVGKTTQLKLAEESLLKNNHKVYVTRTIGGTPIGELLRNVILSDNDRPPETDLHIALASQHALAGDILNRRKQGEIVLIDRSPLSIIAYQIHGDGLQQDKGYTAAQELIELIQPDLSLVYSADNQDLQERRQQRNHHSGSDHFEKQPLEYHERVAEGFKSAAQAFHAKVIDSSCSVEAVHQDTMASIAGLFKT
jgi:dTMP kinase